MPGAQDGIWDSRYFGAGVDGGANAVAVDGDRVFVAGPFRSAGDARAEQIALWNRTTARWTGVAHEVINGSERGEIVDLAILDGDLYAAGAFTSIDGVAVSRVARWDGHRWHPVGSLIQKAVQRLRVMEGELYAFGDLGCDPVKTCGVVRLDGGEWTLVGERNVREMLVHGEERWLAGYSTFSYPFVTHWEGSTARQIEWNTPLPRTGQAPTSIVRWNGQIFAGGSFHGLAPEGVDHVARWDGTTWRRVGLGLTEPVSRLLATDDALYAVTALRVHRWNGLSWSEIGVLEDAPELVTIRDLESDAGTPVIAGSFHRIGGGFARSVARWNPGDGKWEGFADNRAIGFDGETRAIARLGDELLVGGHFQHTGTVHMPWAAIWDGSSWRWAGEGLDGPVLELASSGAGLFAVAKFETPEGPVQGVGRYVSGRWQFEGVTGAGLRLSVLGDKVHVAGSVQVDDELYSLATWNGSGWTPLLDSTDVVLINAVTSWDSSLFIAGEFETIQGKTIPSIARRKGSGWNALGTGLEGSYSYVSWLAPTTEALWVSGDFSIAGGKPADGLAYWDGSSWTPVETGDGSGGAPLANIGDVVYVGPQYHVMRWDGSQWHRLGGPFSNWGAVKGVDGELFVVGRFTTIGDLPSPYFARWQDCEATVAACPSTTTTMPPGPGCGDPTDDGNLSAADALLVLRAAVGNDHCPICVCDIDATDEITAADALRLLRIAVGHELELHCPPCTG